MSAGVNRAAPNQILVTPRILPSYPLSLTAQATQVLVPGMTYTYTALGGENVDVRADGTPSGTSGTSPSAFVWIAHTKPDTTIEMPFIGGLLSTSNGLHIGGFFTNLVAGSHTFWLAYTLTGAGGASFVFDQSVQINGYPRASLALALKILSSGA